MAPCKHINVRSCDSVTINIDSKTLRVSPVFRANLEGKKNGDVIDVEKINGVTLNQVLWWMTNHMNDDDLEEPDVQTLGVWDRDFLETANLVAIINASSYLGVRKLYLQAMKKLADNVNEKFAEKQPIEQIRKMFNITENFSKAENAENKKNPIFESLMVNREFDIKPANVGVVYLPPRELPLGYDEMKDRKQTKQNKN